MAKGAGMPSDPSYLEQLKGYSLSELLDIQDNIDRQAYPDRYALVVAGITERRAALSPEDAASPKTSECVGERIHA